MRWKASTFTAPDSEADAKAYTITLDSLCGVKLNNNKVYLISGQVRKRKLELNQCHWNQEWPQITVR